MQRHFKALASLGGMTMSGLPKGTEPVSIQRKMNMCNGFWLRFTFDECMLCLNCVCGCLSLFKLLVSIQRCTCLSVFSQRFKFVAVRTECVSFVHLNVCVCVCALCFDHFARISSLYVRTNIVWIFIWPVQSQISTAYRITKIELRCSSVYIDTTLWCCILIINTIHLCNAIRCIKNKFSVAKWQRLYVAHVAVVLLVSIASPTAICILIDTFLHYWTMQFDVSVFFSCVCVCLVCFLVAALLIEINLSALHWAKWIVQRFYNIRLKSISVEIDLLDIVFEMVDIFINVRPKSTTNVNHFPAKRQWHPCQSVVWFLFKN